MQLGNFEVLLPFGLPSLPGPASCQWLPGTARLHRLVLLVRSTQLTKPGGRSLCLLCVFFWETFGGGAPEHSYVEFAAKGFSKRHARRLCTVLGLSTPVSTCPCLGSPGPADD